LQKLHLEKPFSVHNTTAHRCRTPFSRYLPSSPAASTTPGTTPRCSAPWIPSLLSQILQSRDQDSLLDMGHKDNIDLTYETGNLSFHMSENFVSLGFWAVPGPLRETCVRSCNSQLLICTSPSYQRQLVLPPAAAPPNKGTQTRKGLPESSNASRLLSQNHVI